MELAKSEIKFPQVCTTGSEAEGDGVSVQGQQDRKGVGETLTTGAVK